MNRTIRSALLVIGLLSSFAQAQSPARRVPEGMVIHRDLAYVAAGHERQKLDLYLPQIEQTHPVIVWIHGGDWLAGS